MSFRTRFVALAIFNSLLLFGFLFVFSQNGLASSQRLVDLNLENAKDLQVFVVFLGGLLLGFIVNFFLLSSRKTEFNYEQIGMIVKALKIVSKQENYHKQIKKAA